MLCPICKVDLQISERQGIEIDYCPKCRGVWLDRGELDKIIERSNSSMESYGQQHAESAYVPDGRKKKHDYPDGELPYDYDDDRDRYEPHDRRYTEADYKRRRRKSFLDDIFDVFD